MDASPEQKQEYWKYMDKVRNLNVLSGTWTTYYKHQKVYIFGYYVGKEKLENIDDWKDLDILRSVITYACRQATCWCLH